MAKSHVSLRILEDDYDAFREIVREDAKLPVLYRAWLERAVAENKASIAKGYTLQVVLVTPGGFKKYCKGLELVPSYFALEAYALELSV